jgi:hypothetical protein
LDLNSAPRFAGFYIDLNVIEKLNEKRGSKLSQDVRIRKADLLPIQNQNCQDRPAARSAVAATS